MKDTHRLTRLGLEPGRPSLDTYRFHDLARRLGWYDGIDFSLLDEQGQIIGRSLGNDLMNIVTEVAEAQEELRDGYHVQEVRFRKRDGKPEGFPIELADIIIRCYDVAYAHGIDVEKAIEIKHAFNATRPHRHGGKKS